jgi:hypothetical protein
MSDAEAHRRARFNLILIGAIAVLPLVGSYLLYLFWRPSSFVNHGELVAPAQVVMPAAEDVMYKALQELSGKWVLAMVDSGACEEFCRQKLYYLRQVRLTQGKDMERIERLWIITDPIRPQESLLKEYMGTRLVMAGQSPWVRQLPARSSATDHLYIIDPLGNVILRYSRDLDPSGMKKDLQRLLRASRIG